MKRSFQKGTRVYVETVLSGERLLQTGTGNSASGLVFAARGGMGAQMLFFHSCLPRGFMNENAGMHDSWFCVFVYYTRKRLESRESHSSDMQMLEMFKKSSAMHLLQRKMKGRCSIKHHLPTKN